jgi:hypothetical protein
MNARVKNALNTFTLRYGDRFYAQVFRFAHDSRKWQASLQGPKGLVTTGLVADTQLGAISNLEDELWYMERSANHNGGGYLTNRPQWRLSTSGEWLPYPSAQED